MSLSGMDCFLTKKRDQLWPKKNVSEVKNLLNSSIYRSVGKHKRENR